MKKENDNLLKSNIKMKKQITLNDKEKEEIDLMRQEIVKNLEKMLNKIENNQNVKTVKLDIIQTLKVLFKKNTETNNNVI